jgi:alpha-L-rhamnosidase
MNPIDRRTFLVNGTLASGAVVAASALGAREAAASPPLPPARAEAAAAATSPAAPLQVKSLTVNGLTNPVGVDPDDCNFAWLLASPGRGGRQVAYRIAVHRADPRRTGQVWDSGAVTSGRQAFVRYGGPRLSAGATYRWTASVQDAAGRWSRPAPSGRFGTTLRQEDWTAQWLHPAAASQQPDQITYLRSVCTPPAGTVARATAYVAAAHTYRLFLDGQLIDFGPGFCFPDEQYFRAVDVTAHLRPGTTNCVGVLQRWYGGGKGRPVSAPGLLLQLDVLYADGRRFTHGTDGSWKEHPAEWLASPLRNTEGYDFVEWVDGRAHPQGWATTGFDDTGWTPTTVRGPVGTAPFTKLFAQRTSVEEHVVGPVSRRLLPNGSLVFDFGAIYPARIRVRFTEGEDGRTIPMHVGYLLDPDGAVSTTHATQTTNLSFSYISRPGAQVFEALTYLGFRYLQVDNPGHPIGADQVEAIASHTAMPDVPAGTFIAGDRMLNAVWKLNARSSFYCTQEHFIDTPTREKGQFVWDAANVSEVIMGTYGDQNLSWQGLRDVARGQDRYWPDGQVNECYPNGNGAHSYPTFTERYPEWLWRYYVTTGDVATTVLLYPSLQKVADFLWSGRVAATGLLTGFGDQSDGDPVYGYDLSVVADTPSNVLGVNAFKRIAQVAELAGDRAGSQVQLTRAAQLTEAINARFTRADGIYVDGIRPDGSQSTSASQESNALALAYGIVPLEHELVVGNYVASLGVNLGPNHGLELMRGLAQAGLYGDMVRMLTDTSIPGWAHIVAAGGTFCWEEWTPSDLIGDSLSHGWGSSAEVAMQEALLGVTLQEPDRDGVVQALISPPTSGLPAARGSVHSIAGPIAVSWKRRPNGLALSAAIPPNATARVSVAAVGAAQVREGGVPVDRAEGVSVAQVGGGRVVLAVGSGSYRFEVSGA